jgi:hypothetical protein
MKNKLYLATAIMNFIVCGAYIAIGQHVLAPFWSAAGGIWLYLWSRKD